jgi:hypothetical protein
VATDELINRWVERLRAEVPDAVAIFLAGGYVRGDAGPHSDLDFDILVATGPRDEWPGWSEEVDGGLLRISTWIRDVDTWRGSQAEPQRWAFGLACVDPWRLCWAADAAWQARLHGAEARYPPSPIELDHFESGAGKVGNARASRDDLGLRLAAQDLVRAAISVLEPLNSYPPVRGRRDALRTALDFAVAPPGYRDDAATCLGLTSATSDAVYAAAARLALGTLDVVDAHPETYAAILDPVLLGWLGDGSLRRIVRAALTAG